MDGRLKGVVFVLEAFAGDHCVWILRLGQSAASISEDLSFGPVRMRPVPNSIADRDHRNLSLLAIDPRSCAPPFHKNRLSTRILAEQIGANLPILR